MFGMYMVSMKNEYFWRGVYFVIAEARDVDHNQETLAFRFVFNPLPHRTSF